MLTAQEGVVLVAGAGPEAECVSFPATRYYTPVVVKQHLVWVRASVNGQAGWFLLDTGAPVVMWNQAASGDPSAAVEARGVAGRAAFVPARADFEWGHLQVPGLPGLAGDLSGLAALNGQAVQGIIGMQVLRHSRLTLDFARQTLLLETRPAPPTNTNAAPLCEWPLRWAGHLPVVEIQAGKRTLRLGIDTGASVNLLDEALVGRSARKASRSEAEESVLLQFLGMEGQRWPVREVALQTGAITFHPPFVCLPFRQMAEEMELDIDGLLGYPFLSRFRVVLDFEHGMMQLWPAEAGQ